MLQAVRLHYTVPGPVHGRPGGPYADSLQLAPFSRIPTGEHAEIHHPSLIDLICSDFEMGATPLLWDAAVADHAVVCATLESFAADRRPRSTWKADDEASCVSTMAAAAASVVPPRLHEAVLQASIDHADSRSCSRQRAERAPFAARDLFAKAAAAAAEAARRELKRQAWAVLRMHIHAVQLSVICSRVKRGGVVMKSKKLHVIQRLKLPRPGDDELLVLLLCMLVLRLHF